MSSKEQKAMKKSAKRPRVDKTLPSDDSRNPVAANPDSPAVGTSEMGSLSSGSDLKEAREPVPKRMQNFKGDVNRLLREKRKQFEKDVNASFRSLNENLQGILKAQQNSREELKSIYCETFGSLHQKWLDEVDRTKDEEEHLSVSGALSLEHILCCGRFPGGRVSCSRSGGKGQDMSSGRQGGWWVW
uniref:XLR/SYCP3/FAM9 domain-containing protein n=1 Tax=Rattus norvegicus TaxID=10116 RepID=A0ABK0LZL4_RAT